MNVASAQFLVLAVVTALAYHALGSRWWRQSILLAANVYFLSQLSNEVSHFWPLAAFLLVGYLGALLVRRGHERLFWPAVVADVAMLVWLKKYAFVPSAVVLHEAYVTVGLSYICFRMLYALIEAKDGTLRRLDPLLYLNYTINFLTLVSGPIQRFSEFADQQLGPDRSAVTIVDVGLGLERIALGFFKVVLLSAAFASLQARGLGLADGAADLAQRTLAAALIVGAYPLYLYSNFSGYIDIVIGVGRWLGMRLPENFERPFLSGNFMTFWGRWHITLSSFFRTYLFNPLLMKLMGLFGSSAAAPFLAVFAFFVTFFVLGLWHGQTSEFAAYGLVLGVGVSVNKLYQILMVRALGAKRYQALAARPPYAAVCRGLTFSYFALSLLVFWSNWRQLGDLWQRLGGTAVAAGVLGLFGAATILLSLDEALQAYSGAWRLRGRPVLQSRYLRTAATTALAWATWFAMTIVNTPAPENVYKAF